jgi:hypothetical protein
MFMSSGFRDGQVEDGTVVVPRFALDLHGISLENTIFIIRCEPPAHGPLSQISIRESFGI